MLVACFSASVYKVSVDSFRARLSTLTRWAIVRCRARMRRRVGNTFPGPSIGAPVFRVRRPERRQARASTIPAQQTTNITRLTDSLRNAGRGETRTSHYLAAPNKKRTLVETDSSKDQRKHDVVHIMSRTLSFLT